MLSRLAVFVASFAAAGVVFAEPVAEKTAGETPSENTPVILTRETAWFTICGESAKANSIVAGYAAGISRALADCGVADSHRGSRKVIVTVAPGENPPALRTGPDFIDLRIETGAKPSEFSLLKTLARAALARLAQAANRAPNPSDWAAEALAWEARVSAHSGLLERLVRTAEKSGPGTLEELSEPNHDEREERGCVAFILLRSLRRTGETAALRALAEGSIGTPLPKILDIVTPTGIAKDGATRALLWPEVFYRETDLRNTLVDSPDQSDQRLAGLMRFVVWKDGADHTIDAQGLIAMRNDPDLARGIARRIDRIKTALLRANPVWFNAIRDHGVFLEKLPTSPPEELNALWHEAHIEAERARRTSAEIVSLLEGR